MRNASVRGLALAGLCLLTAPAAGAALLEEDFSSDPNPHGWRVTGDPSLFHWDPQQGELAVTWDSSKANSFFHRPIGTILAKDDDFRLAFSVTLEDLAVGSTPGKAFTFELAVGLLNIRQAAAPGYLRGTGMDSPNLIEWNYFPDSGFGATVSTTVISTNHQWGVGFNVPVELALTRRYQFVLDYSGATRTLRTSMSSAEGTVALKEVVLGPEFDDFRLDALAVASYSDAGQDPQYAGSVLAHGRLDDISLRLPDPPLLNLVGGWAGGQWEMTFLGVANWVYALERSRDLRTWEAVGAAVPGLGGQQTLADPEPSRAAAFYRVRSERP